MEGHQAANQSASPANPFTTELCYVSRFGWRTFTNAQIPRSSPSVGNAKRANSIEQGQESCGCAVPRKGSSEAIGPCSRGGNVLLCALSEANCRNGSVSPREVQVFQSRGVRVLIREDLHASAISWEHELLSRQQIYQNTPGIHSMKPLCIPRTSKSFVRSRIGLLSGCGSLSRPEWLAHCKKIYRPPKRIEQNRTKTNRRLRPIGHHLVNWHPTDGGS